MDSNRTGWRSYRHVWIVVGAALFLVALTISAAAVPALRLLHFLQALLYVAVVTLAGRNSSWGLGAGVFVACAWNSLNLFVTHFIQAGAVSFWMFLHTGKVDELVAMMVTLGGVGHFILIIACIAMALEQRSSGSWWRFIGGGIAGLGYMALIIAVARPR
jgi:hypothetical protein